MTDPYRQFLEAKVAAAPTFGFGLSNVTVSDRLLPHQAVIVPWMVEGGRRALFARFGLGKTVMQLEAVRICAEHENDRGLIVLPLGVRQEFRRDAVEVLGWSEPPRFIRSIDEADATGVYLTNYETVRDGKIDPRHFVATSLDEASVLRGFGGTKTFREFMRTFAGDGKTLNARIRGNEVKYRFVATATPSPNDYIELLAYAAFLGIMEVSQAKTRFFKRNSEKADELTIHPHKEAEFWHWVSTWALFITKPSDLGLHFSDAGYELPELDVRWHEIPSDHSDAGQERDGQGLLFRNVAIGVTNAAKEKRDSLPARIEKMLQIRAEDTDAHRIIWHDLEAEREAIEDVLPIATYERWQEFRDGHPAAIALYERHYSARSMAKRELICGPGEKLILLTGEKDALFAWRKFIDDSGQQGINCAVFRNEGWQLSSELIREACAIAWKRWPGARLYTYVDATQVRSPNPGACFQIAGWRKCGTTKAGLLIFERFPTDDIKPLVCRDGLRSVYGSQELEEREQTILDFSDGLFAELAAKPVIAGSGCNFQRHCHSAIFLGIGFKFNDFIQAIHRIHRFLQKHRVRVDLIYTEAERDVRRQLERKWSQYREMVEKMTAIIREHGLSHAGWAKALTRSIGVERCAARGEAWEMVNNDCVDETQRMEGDSVGLIVTSIPFSTQYEYSPNYADFGHSDNNEHFFKQMDFLTPQLLRVLKPGRIAAIHVKDRIVPGGMTGLGMQTVYPFHAECIRHYVQHGFAYMGMKTIVTDVVRENNQTYRLGWTEQCKDGSKMGVGMPEYLLLFRKPPTDTSNSYADLPVVKSKEKYSRARWQVDAHGFTRSSGNRPITAADLEGMPHDAIFKLFRDYHLSNVYDFEHHVKLGEALDAKGMLPVTFMLLQPPSWSDEVWSNIARMLTLNGAQSAKGKEMHLCPMQFDIADRAIEQWSMPGELVFDPFAGLGTVPYRAVLKGRRGLGVELSHPYWLDACAYCKAAEQEIAMPDLFAAIQPTDERAA